MADLAGDYRSGAEALRPFFAKPLAGWNAAPGPPRPLAPRLHAELAAYQTPFRCTRNVPSASHFIVTGQQPALFGGPLYTLYKALTAWRMAAIVEHTHGVPCTPLFWLAGDDHDFAEAQSASFIDKSGGPFALRYEPSTPTGAIPLYAVPIESGLHQLIDQAADDAPGADFKEEIRAFLHESLAASPSLHEWSAHIVARLTRSAPVALFAPHTPEARREAAPIIAREIAEPLASTRLLNEAGARLEALGYGAQVVKGPDEINFFIDCEGHRRKVVYRDDIFHVLGEKLRYDANELAALLQAEPGRFSPNVVLRPIVQQRLFSPIAYVAGPGEIAYWAQLRGVFEHFGEAMPVVYPRASAVLRSPKIHQLQTQLGIAAEPWREPAQAVEETVLRRLPENGRVLDAAEPARRTVLAAMESLSLAMHQEGAEYGQRADVMADRVAKEWRRFERGLIRADQERAIAARNRARRVLNALAPYGKPQERVYTPFAFLFEHGWDLVERIRDELDIESFVTTELDL